MNKITFLGLGVMGYPMAGHLTKRQESCEIAVYNRTASKAATWQEQYGGKTYSAIAAAVAQADIVLCCLGNDDDVRQVLCEAMAYMKRGAILVDHSTTSAGLAEELAQAAKGLGLSFMDAPVSGGQAGAENGKLTIMCGGEREIFVELERKVFPAYAQSAVYMGNYGQGQRAKMVNQICIAGVLRGLSEGLLLAEKAGLEVPTLIACLKNGAAGSWQMENRAETMAQGQYDFGFAIEWMAKDLSYALKEARRCGLELAHAQQSLEQYRQLIDSGHGRKDSSCIHRAIAKQSKQQAASN